MRSAFRFALLFTFSILFSAAAAAQNGGDPDFTPAKLIKTPSMKVPEESKKSGLGGKIDVQVNVRKDGTVASVGSVSGPDFVCPAVTRPDVVAMRDAAKAAALEARFEPAKNGDKPTDSWMLLTFNFPQKVTETVKGDKNYTAAPVPKPSRENKDPEPPTRYTIKGNIVSMPPSGDPPDYAGPVAAAGSTDSRTISGGVVNGKATKLTRPDYPPAARAVRASGAVTIQVLIDESGDIFRAFPVSGHPLLRSSARLAACSSKFSPTLLEGNPVKVSGVITYNFVP